MRVLRKHVGCFAVVGFGEKFTNHNRKIDEVEVGLIVCLVSELKRVMIFFPKHERHHELYGIDFFQILDIGRKIKFDNPQFKNYWMCVKLV